MSILRDHRNNYVNHDDPYTYQQGWGNLAQSEAIKGALPQGQNAPQKCPHGLYAEQLTGTAFTAPRHDNLKSWLYRIRPAAAHQPYVPYEEKHKGYDSRRVVASFIDGKNATPQQFRWMPPRDQTLLSSTNTDTSTGTGTGNTDFVSGLFTVCGAGNAAMKNGVAIHMYVCDSDMHNRAMCNSDGELLIVPQQGTLKIQTEFGWIQVQPTEVCVIPRGVRFAVHLHRTEQHEGESNNKSKAFRGYIAEVFHGRFVIPDLGPIGANGLANPRDFHAPVAAYEDRDGIEFELVHKYQGKLFSAMYAHSVFNVVAWHGNYMPYKYDLKLFNAMNTVSYDHPDPSIYTVLTCQSSVPGTAVCDFVIFPPRWAVSEHTFRPPYYHRNTMSEYMGLIYGSYEAKEKGFVPGGSSLHNCMSAHGPESTVTYKNEECPLAPSRVADGSLAFMFESMYMFNPTDFALEVLERDTDYHLHWVDAAKRFTGPANGTASH